MSAIDAILDRKPGQKRYMIGAINLVRRRGRPVGSRNATSRVGTAHYHSPKADLDRTNGRSFKHRPGYLPIYPGLTDLPAFWHGVEAGRASRSIRGGDRYETSKERESFFDGWLWAQAHLPDAIKPGESRRWVRLVKEAG